MHECSYNKRTFMPRMVRFPEMRTLFCLIVPMEGIFSLG